MINCRDCKYYAYSKATDDLGQCRLNPPIGLAGQSPLGLKVLGAWPQIAPECCCGQGVQREEAIVHIDKEVAAANGAGKAHILV